jgi:hypothetical protein
MIVYIYHQRLNNGVTTLDGVQTHNHLPIKQLGKKQDVDITYFLVRIKI